MLGWPWIGLAASLVSRVAGIILCARPDPPVRGVQPSRVAPPGASARSLQLVLTGNTFDCLLSDILTQAEEWLRKMMRG
jgi:hypothetical protein